MAKKPQNSHQKGVIAIEEYQGRLRLRWSYAGKRYCLALGLPNSKVNLKAANQRAIQIELDIASANFDVSLQKYKPPSQKCEQLLDICAVELFQRFIEYKAKSIYSRSQEKYHTTLKNLEKCFGRKSASSIKCSEAEKFADWLSKKLSPLTLKERLTLVKAAWEWGIKQNLLKENPWLELPSRVKVPPKPMPKPFSRQEIGAILSAFEGHRNYKFYLPFVKFRFLTGTRVGEATGLRWQDVSEDCSQIWIGSTLTRGVRKSTKTNKARIFPCNQRLQEFLKSIRPVECQSGDLVFPSPRGTAINDSLFGKRAWNTCLKIAGIEYRSFYNVRHTFISHCLERGMSPTTVAHLVGHDVQVLYENYAGSVVSKPQIPDFF